jgi:hypothetical protein
MRPRWQIRVLLTVTAALVLALGTSLPASAASLERISTDPYTNPDSAHKTEVEPDTFAFGHTIVSTFQVGRFFNGGATNTGFAVSHDGGSTGSTASCRASPWPKVARTTVPATRPSPTTPSTASG